MRPFCLSRRGPLSSAALRSSSSTSGSASSVGSLFRRGVSTTTATTTASCSVAGTSGSGCFSASAPRWAASNKKSSAKESGGLGEGLDSFFAELRAMDDKGVTKRSTLRSQSNKKNSSSPPSENTTTTKSGGDGAVGKPQSNKAASTVCEQCGKRFKSPSALAVHISERHAPKPTATTTGTGTTTRGRVVIEDLLSSSPPSTTSTATSAAQSSSASSDRRGAGSQQAVEGGGGGLEVRIDESERLIFMNSQELQTELSGLQGKITDMKEQLARKKMEAARLESLGFGLSDVKKKASGRKQTTATTSAGSVPLSGEMDLFNTEGEDGDAQQQQPVGSDGTRGSPAAGTGSSTAAADPSSGGGLEELLETKVLNPFGPLVDSSKGAQRSVISRATISRRFPQFQVIGTTQHVQLSGTVSGEVSYGLVGSGSEADLPRALQFDLTTKTYQSGNLHRLVMTKSYFKVRCFGDFSRCILKAGDVLFITGRTSIHMKYDLATKKFIEEVSVDVDPAQGGVMAKFAVAASSPAVVGSVMAAADGSESQEAVSASKDEDDDDVGAAEESM